MKKWITALKLVVMVVVFSLPVTVSAQTGFDDDVCDNPPCEPEPVPFDGGAGFLVAAAVGYGLKKARDHKKSVKKD